MKRFVALACALLATGCALGWLGRYRLIEPEDLNALCAAAPAAGWCALRSELIRITFSGGFGYAAAGAALFAWLGRGWLARAAALFALFAGGLGLYLFDTDLGAAAVLAALLRLPSTVGSGLAVERPAA